MLNTLKEYNNELKKLYDYLEETDRINIFLCERTEEELLKNEIRLYRGTTKKIYDYKLSIITLYGLIEGFIENIVKRYLEKLSSNIDNYNDLPQLLRENHLNFSADLIKNIDRLSKYRDLSKSHVIKNLYECVGGNKPYHINVDAFTYHSANFRQETIQDFFKKVGIENIIDGLCKKGIFTKYFIDNEGMEESDLKSYKHDKFFEILDDIVERRNEIAHGNEVFNILSLSEIKLYLKYVDSLISGIFEIMYENFIKIFFYAHKAEFVSLGNPIHIYSNFIIGINNQNNRMYVGMDIYLKKGNRIRKSKIISMEYQKNSIEKIESSEKKDIGIKLDMNVKKNDQVFIRKI